MTVIIDDFITDSSRLEKPEDLFDLYKNTLYEFGYDKVVYSLITDHPSIDKPSGHAVMANYPEDWLEYYSEKGYGAKDPVPKQAFKTNNIFKWDSLEEDGALDAEEKLVMNEARDAKLLDGIGLPIHGPNGEISGVGIASSMTGVKADKLILSKIRMITMQFHFSYMELAKKDKRVNEVCLTAKEKEILYWCAEGKSNTDIAEIIGVSIHAVKFHLNNIFAKLQANDRVLAVVKALRCGLISPSYVRPLVP